MPRDLYFHNDVNFYLKIVIHTFIFCVFSKIKSHEFIGSYG